MSAMILRSYQHMAELDVLRAWRAGHRGALLAIPTGSGKTVTCLHIADRTLVAGGTVLWLGHLDVLLEQALRSAARFGHAGSLLRASDPRYNPRARLQVASMQSLVRRKVPWTPDLIVIDEAHHAACNTLQIIMSRWPEARVLGPTASPWRCDGRPLREAGFSAIITTTTPEKLIASKHLVPPDLREAKPCDMTGAKKIGGEYVAAEVERRVMPGLGDVVRGTCDAVRDGHGPAVVFCASVAHSKALAQALCDYGVRAEHLDADTPSDEREAILGERGRLVTGQTEAICWVGLGDEGVDVPTIGTVVLASPTASSGRYLQRIGRGLRPVLAPDGTWALRPDGTPVKASCLVLDYGGNIHRHGLPTEDLSPWYSLDGSPQALRAADPDAEKPIALTTCKQCFAVFPVGLRGSGAARGSPGGCPKCGHIEPVKPVAIIDRGTVLGAVQPADVTSWAERWEAWNQIAAHCIYKGYRDGWAGMQYRAKFGRQAWPTSAMQARLRQARERAVAVAAEAAAAGAVAGMASP